MAKFPGNIPESPVRWHTPDNGRRVNERVRARPRNDVLTIGPPIGSLAHDIDHITANKFKFVVLLCVEPKEDLNLLVAHLTIARVQDETAANRQWSERTHLCQIYGRRFGDSRQ